MNKRNQSLIITSVLLLFITPLAAMNLNIDLLEQNLHSRVSENTTGVGLVVGVIEDKQSKIITVGKANKSNSKIP